jgi:hypothetical protein
MAGFPEEVAADVYGPGSSNDSLSNMDESVLFPYPGEHLHTASDLSVQFTAMYLPVPQSVVQL